MPRELKDIWPIISNPALKASTTTITSTSFFRCSDSDEVGSRALLVEEAKVEFQFDQCALGQAQEPAADCATTAFQLPEAASFKSHRVQANCERDQFPGSDFNQSDECLSMAILTS